MCTHRVRTLLWLLGTDPTSLEAHFQVAAEAGSGKGPHRGAALGQAVWQELPRKPQ